MVKYWIKNISRNIGAVIFKLGTINVHQKSVMCSNCKRAFFWQRLYCNSFAGKQFVRARCLENSVPCLSTWLSLPMFANFKLFWSVIRKRWQAQRRNYFWDSLAFFESILRFSKPGSFNSDWFMKIPVMFLFRLSALAMRVRNNS